MEEVLALRIDEAHQLLSLLGAKLKSSAKELYLGTRGKTLGNQRLRVASRPGSVVVGLWRGSKLRLWVNYRLNPR